MNLELKGIKIAKFASQETYCFEAALYLDGKKVAIVSNQGHGGCDSVHWLDRSAEKLVNDYMATLPPESSTFAGAGSLPMDLELWCGKRLEQHELDKSIARIAKKKTVFRLNDDDQLMVRELSVPYGPKTHEFLTRKYAGNATVYNPETKEWVAI